MGFKVLLAGQDITAYVQEMSVKIEDTLAQGAGTGGGGSTGRAKNATFLTSLGPAASAYGAGQTLPPTGGPYLVRYGDVQVFDANNTLIFRGNVCKLDDKTDKITPYTEVTCWDLYQDLNRITVNKTYVGQSDTQILADLLTTYAPTIYQSGIGPSAYTFPTLVFYEMTLQKAIQYIADATGYEVWIGADSVFHYIPLSAAQVAPFKLSDTGVNDTTVGGMWVTQYTQDDTAIINEVIVRGGTKTSADFTQDLSPQANGTNKKFILAYVPHKASDGAIHVTKNGSELVVGYVNQDALKGDGGSCDVLVDQDNRNLTFDSAPAGTDTLTTKYAYHIPIVVTVEDTVSQAYFGRKFTSVIDDSQIADVATAVVRARAVLAQQNYGLTHLVAGTRQSGLLAGMLVQVDHTIRGIHGQFQVQKVTWQPQGGGVWFYQVEMGAWKWNIVDVIQQVSNVLFNENNNTLNPDQEVVTATGWSTTIHASAAWTSATRTPASYYPEAAPVGDGHDLYPGLGTI